MNANRHRLARDNVWGMGAVVKMTHDRRSTLVLSAGFAAWLLMLGLGLPPFLSYENTAGRGGNAPLEWPADSALGRARGLPTLVMMMHPRCPCSRASLSELALLLAEARGRVSADVVFVRPPGLAWERERGESWDVAASIPGVRVSVDEGGVEARRFGSETSGQVMLYGSDGRLRFSGGITAARGHEGDNMGLRAVAALLTDGDGVGGTPVFGCPIFGEPAGGRKDESCDAKLEAR